MNENVTVRPISGSGEMAQRVKSLLCNHEDLDLGPQTPLRTHIKARNSSISCYSSTGEVERPLRSHPLGHLSERESCGFSEWYCLRMKSKVQGDGGRRSALTSGLRTGASTPHTCADLHTPHQTHTHRSLLLCMVTQILTIEKRGALVLYRVFNPLLLRGFSD